MINKCSGPSLQEAKEVGPEVEVGPDHPEVGQEAIVGHDLQLVGPAEVGQEAIVQLGHHLVHQAQVVNLKPSKIYFAFHKYHYHEYSFNANDNV